MKVLSKVLAVVVCVAMGASACVMSPTAAGPVGLASKNVTTFAGQAGAIGSVDGTGTGAAFWFPAGGVIDNTVTYLYVADSANSTIRRISLSNGAVATIAGVAGFAGYFDNSGTGLATSYFNHPEGIATDGSSLYVADSGNNAIRKIATPGVGTSVVSTIAGNLNGFPGSADGSGSAASFNNPLGICYDSLATSLFVADSGNSTIRKVTTAGAVTTIAGQAGVFGSSDGIGTAATFTYPEGIVFDSDELDPLCHRHVELHNTKPRGFKRFGFHHRRPGRGEGRRRQLDRHVCKFQLARRDCN